MIIIVTLLLHPNLWKPNSKACQCKSSRYISANLFRRSFLDGEEYDAKRSRQMTQNIADMIRSRVKDMGFPRYKIVTNVVITPGSGQSMQYNSRCLWDVSTDSFASATYKNSSLYAVVTVHAVYFE